MTWPWKLEEHRGMGKDGVTSMDILDLRVFLSRHVQHARHAAPIFIFPLSSPLGMNPRRNNLCSIHWIPRCVWPRNHFRAECVSTSQNWTKAVYHRRSSRRLSSLSPPKASSAPRAMRPRRLPKPPPPSSSRSSSRRSPPKPPLPPPP